MNTTKNLGRNFVAIGGAYYLSGGAYQSWLPLCQLAP
jgi:hypothetical protein